MFSLLSDFCYFRLVDGFVNVNCWLLMTRGECFFRTSIAVRQNNQAYLTHKFLGFQVVQGAMSCIHSLLRVQRSVISVIETYVFTVPRRHT